MWWTNPISYYGNLVEKVDVPKPAYDYMGKIAGINHVTFADISIGFSMAIETPLSNRIYGVTGQQAWDYLWRYTQDTIKKYTQGKINQSLGDIKVKAEIREKNGLYLIGLSARNVPNTAVDFLQIRVSEQPTFTERAKKDLDALVNVMLQR